MAWDDDLARKIAREMADQAQRQKFVDEVMNARRPEGSGPRTKPRKSEAQKKRDGIKGAFAGALVGLLVGGLAAIASGVIVWLVVDEATWQTDLKDVIAMIVLSVVAIGCTFLGVAIGRDDEV